MMRKVFAAGLLFALVGCDMIPTPDAMAVAPVTYHPVSYYSVNPLERSQTLAWCAENSGLEGKVPDCDNAATARRHAFNRQMGWE